MHKDADIKKCNCCGKEIQMQNKVQVEDALEVRKSWGYFSKKDGKVHKFLICEACYDNWTAQFQIPVTREDETEYL